MRIVMVTTASDSFGGVFAAAYQKAGGPAPNAVVVLPVASEPPWYNSIALALKSSSIVNLVRLAMARLGFPTSNETLQAVRSRWPDAICDAQTTRHELPNLRDAANVRVLAELTPDILVSVGAPVVFGHDVLREARVAALNVHNGRLPEYRGHFGTFWELFHGETWSYVCVHRMVSKVDSGEIVASDRVRLADFASLLEVMLEKKRRGGALLARVVNRVINGDPYRESDLPETASAGRHFNWPSVSDILALRSPRATGSAENHQ